ncbi:MAG: hypothetical protein ACK5Y6_03085 [Pseudomonadota bacterium]
MTTNCYHCVKPLTLDTTNSIKFRDTCSHCGSDAHVCRNCQFYDQGAYHECRESSAEWVRDKERGNRCEYFKLRTAGEDDGSNKKKAALSALDDLFK